MVLVREDTRRQQIAREETVKTKPKPLENNEPDSKEEQPNASTPQADDDVNAGKKHNNGVS